MKPIYLVITPFFPSSNSFRGPFILDQVKAIQKNSNYQVIVLKPKLIYRNTQDYEFDGIKVNHFSVFDLPSNFLPGLFNRLSNIAMFNALKKENISFNQIKIIHAHSIEMGYYANAIKVNSSRAKTVLQFHGLDVLGLKKGFLRSVDWHKQWIVNRAANICNKIDLHVGVSNATLSNFANYEDIKLKNNFVLYNGVDTKKFYRKEGLRDENIFTIGCIGNFIPLKDQITLIKAIQNLVTIGTKDIRAKFIGTGPTLKYCQNYVNNNNLQEFISFQQEVKHNKLMDFYNSLDLFILPSYYEALGCVYLEAFACGVPFMAVKGQGIEELLPIAEKKYWLFEKSNAEELSQLIQSYRTSKREQTLINPLDINTLILEFLEKVD